jgi:hypothetical protein
MNADLGLITPDPNPVGITKSNLVPFDVTWTEFPFIVLIAWCESFALTILGKVEDIRMFGMWNSVSSPTISGTFAFSIEEDICV